MGMGNAMTAGSGQLADWTDVLYAVAPPAARLVQQSSQAVAHNTATAITFGVGSEVRDDYLFHDETVNPSRLIPKIAGWYEVWGAVSLGGKTDFTSLTAFLRTNGATAVAPAHKPALPSGATTNQTVILPVPAAQILFNGSTDYVEIVAQFVNTAAGAGSTVVSFQLASTLECKLIQRT